jgi:hypothetical protein
MMDLGGSMDLDGLIDRLRAIRESEGNLPVGFSGPYGWEVWDTKFRSKLLVIDRGPETTEEDDAPEGSKALMLVDME